jgi:hypothetical protein
MAFVECFEAFPWSLCSLSVNVRHQCHRCQASIFQMPPMLASTFLSKRYWLLTTSKTAKSFVEKVIITSLYCYYRQPFFHHILHTFANVGFEAKMKAYLHTYIHAYISHIGDHNEQKLFYYSLEATVC